MSVPYLYGRGAKWSALIGSWNLLRSRLLEFYDTPDLEFIDAEISRLRELRWEWVDEQRKALKRAQRARRKAA